MWFTFAVLKSRCLDFCNLVVVVVCFLTFDFAVQTLSTSRRNLEVEEEVGATIWLARSCRLQTFGQAFTRHAFSISKSSNLRPRGASCLIVDQTSR